MQLIQSLTPQPYKVVQDNHLYWHAFSSSIPWSKITSLSRMKQCPMFIVATNMSKIEDSLVLDIIQLLSVHKHLLTRIFDVSKIIGLQLSCSVRRPLTVPVQLFQLMSFIWTKNLINQHDLLLLFRNFVASRIACTESVLNLVI